MQNITLLTAILLNIANLRMKQQLFLSFIKLRFNYCYWAYWTTILNFNHSFIFFSLKNFVQMHSFYKNISLWWIKLQRHIYVAFESKLYHNSVSILTIKWNNKIWRQLQPLHHHIGRKTYVRLHICMHTPECMYEEVHLNSILLEEFGRSCTSNSNYIFNGGRMKPINV